MSWSLVCEVLLMLCAFYFATLNIIYFVLCMRSLQSLRLFSPTRIEHFIPQKFSEFMPKVTILVPAHDEEKTICATLRSLLQLEYPSFEIVCINDGSNDSTLEVLKKTFDLEAIAQVPRAALRTREIHAVYRSRTYENLRIIDKHNGGKADALNAGVCYANFDHVACIDSDTILERNSLMGLVRPFLDDPTTVAVGGTIYLANGCTVRNGHIVERGLAQTMLGKFQTLEYLRAFLFGRVGWSSFDALLNISGAFGLFKTQTLVEVGGYLTDTVTEDMDLILRIHAHYRLRNLPYRVHFIAAPICWTDAPESLASLRKQRMRWHRGLAESLYHNRQLFFHARAGFLGAIAMPYQFFFELLQPIMQLLGVILILVCATLSLISFNYLIMLSVMMFFSSLMLSTVCIMLEEAFFHVHSRKRDVLWLYGCAVLENFGYRQLLAVYELMGIYDWFGKPKGSWDGVQRRAAWVAKK